MCVIVSDVAELETKSFNAINLGISIIEFRWRSNEFKFRASQIELLISFKLILRSNIQRRYDQK